MRTATRTNPDVRPAAESFGRIGRRSPASLRLATTSANDADVQLAPRALPPLDATALRASAHAHSARQLGELTLRALHAIRTHARAWRARVRQRALGHATLRALSGLDARALGDLGLSRSELPSAAQQLAGPESTRVRWGQGLTV